jgi:hypothetical protein
MVTVEAKSPYPRYEVSVQAALVEFAEALTDYFAQVHGDGAGWMAHLLVRAPYPADPWRIAVDAIGVARNKAGLPEWPIVRAEVVWTDVPAEVPGRPGFPDIVGPGEVLKMLGVSKQRLHELRTSGRFPLPTVELISGPVWLQAVVEAFEKGWERRPGRPRSVAPSAVLICELCGTGVDEVRNVDGALQDVRRCPNGHLVHLIVRKPETC